MFCHCFSSLGKLGNIFVRNNHSHESLYCLCLRSLYLHMPDQKNNVSHAENVGRLENIWKQSFYHQNIFEFVGKHFRFLGRNFGSAIIFPKWRNIDREHKIFTTIFCSSPKISMLFSTKRNFSLSCVQYKTIGKHKRNFRAACTEVLPGGKRPYELKRAEFSWQFNPHARTG